VAEGQHGQNQRCRAAEEQQHPRARADMWAEREDHLRDAADEQIHAENDRGRDDGDSRPHQHETPRTTASTPDTSVDFQRWASSFGGAMFVMPRSVSRWRAAVDGACDNVSRLSVCL
jgi:hypothetical protein